ncbi:hypothetical protein KL938_005062 [Ogataea parapolymorpha]|nr:hypothetical protein KL938_005062 [Ogataea parapolymorpha]
MPMNCNAIYSELEALKLNVGSINEKMAQKYLGALSNVAINDDNFDSISFTKTLAKILECAPQSEMLDEYLTLSLFEVPMKVNLTTDQDVEIIQSLITIFLYFLSGPFHGRKSTFISIMVYMLSGPSILELVCHKLAGSDITSILLIIDLLSKFLLRVFELQNDELLIRFMAKLMEENTFSNLCKIPAFYEEELTRNQNWKHFLEITKLVYSYLSNCPIDPNDKTHSKLIRNVQTAMNYFNEGFNHKNNYEQLPHDNQEILDNVSNLTLLSAVHVISSFSNPSMVFQKQFAEHQLFNKPIPPHSLYELARGITSAMDPNNLSHSKLINMPIQFSEELFEVLFLCSIDFWDSFKADANDIRVLLHHVAHLFVYFDHLVELKQFEDAIDSLRNMDYEAFRHIELGKIKNDSQEWWNKNCDDFNKIMYDETIGFVKDQHLLMLSRGTWVLSANPISPNGSNRNSPYYFMILSTNHRAMLYKEFSKKPDKKPNIDKDGAKIEFSQISDITYQPMTKNIEKSNLISIETRIQVNRIDIKLKNKGLFSFYVNTIDDLYIWLDGLRMLLSNSTRLSHDTEQQIFWLSSIRKQAQFLELAVKQCDQLNHYNNAFVENDKPKSSEDLTEINSRFYFT